MNESVPTDAAQAHEPMFFLPGVVLALVVALLAIHGALSLASAAAQDVVFRDFAFIPGRLTLAIWPQSLDELLARANRDPAALQQAMMLRHFGVLNGGAKIWTLASYAFLHGSWAHVGVNCIWLVAFGPPIARRFGALRFLLFFGTTAIAGALAHWLYSPMDFAPLIGASAADSGLMAAAARFIFQPGAPLGGPRRFNPMPGRRSTDAPAASIFELLTERRALIFIVIWMGTNFIFGAGAQSLGASEAPVAWIAHVGGFIAGLFTFPLFDRPARSA